MLLFCRISFLTMKLNVSKSWPQLKINTVKDRRNHKLLLASFHWYRQVLFIHVLQDSAISLTMEERYLLSNTYVITIQYRPK